MLTSRILRRRQRPSNASIQEVGRSSAWIPPSLHRKATRQLGILTRRLFDPEKAWFVALWSPYHLPTCPELPNRKKGTGSNKDSFQDSLIGKLVRLSRQSGEDSKVLIQTPSKSRRDAIYVVGVPLSLKAGVVIG